MDCVRMDYGTYGLWIVCIVKRVGGTCDLWNVWIVENVDCGTCGLQEDVSAASDPARGPPVCLLPPDC